MEFGKQHMCPWWVETYSLKSASHRLGQCPTRAYLVKSLPELEMLDATQFAVAHNLQQGSEKDSRVK